MKNTQRTMELEMTIRQTARFEDIVNEIVHNKWNQIAGHVISLIKEVADNVNF